MRIPWRSSGPPLLSAKGRGAIPLRELKSHKTHGAAKKIFPLKNLYNFKCVFGFVVIFLEIHIEVLTDEMI